MTTKDRYLASYRPGNSARKVESLADFLEAVVHGEDLWHGSSYTKVTWSTSNSKGEYQALEALGWSAGSDYGSWGMDWMYVYSPHPEKTEE